MSAPDLETFNTRLDSAIPGLPENATIESVNYQNETTILEAGPQVSASVLIIYSTPKVEG